MAAEPSQFLLFLRIVRGAALLPAVQVATALWVAATVAVFVLADGVLPFDRPALASLSFAQQVTLPPSD